MRLQPCSANVRVYKTISVMGISSSIFRNSLTASYDMQGKKGADTFFAYLHARYPP